MTQVQELSETEIESVSGAAVPAIIIGIVEYFAMKAVDDLLDGGDSFPTKVIKGMQQRLQQK